MAGEENGQVAQPAEVKYQISTKIPQPRALNKVETLDSLNQWKTCMRNYFCRNDQYKKFLLPTTTWNPAAANKGQADETTGLKRTAAEVSEDLEIFLNLVSGYMPFSFLKEKLETDTKGINDVWNIIFEVYRHETTQDSFLNCADLPKDEGETHRQYYERLNSHVRRHLTPPNVTAGGMNSGLAGDDFNITLGNLVVALWMKLTDPRLVKIVRHEYSAELKQGTQLVDLVPRISKNEEVLLAKADANVNKVNAGPSLEEAVAAQLNKIGYGDRFKKNKKFPKNKGQGAKDWAKPNTGNTEVCHHCEHLNRRLKASFNTGHSPESCFRQKVSIRSIEDEGDLTESDEVDTDTGQSCFQNPTSCLNSVSFQSESCARVPGQIPPRVNTVHCDPDTAIPPSTPENENFSDIAVFALQRVKAWHGQPKGSLSQFYRVR